MPLFGRSRQLRVDITGNTTGLERALGRAETRLGKFGRNVGGVSTGAGVSGRGGLSGLAAVTRGGGIAVAAGLGAQKALEFTDAASDLQEQLSKVNIVFGDSAQEISDWSKTTADSVAIARRQALAAAGLFGSMFKGAGQSQEDAARLSESVVELAGDLASFNNTDVDDALNALRSGLSGEIEPLRRFAVFLTEAATRQRAMADTGKTNANQLTQGEKILARYNLILEQTTDAQGDFARTSSGLANQQRRLAAQADDLKTKLGNGLLPLLTGVVSAMNDGIDAAEGLFGALGKLLDVPPIKVTVDFVFGNGRGTEIFKQLILGGISPAARGALLGKKAFDAVFGDEKAPPSVDTSRIEGVLSSSFNRLVGGPATNVFPETTATPGKFQSRTGTALTRQQEILLAQQQALLTESLTNDLQAAKDLAELLKGRIEGKRGKKLFEAKKAYLAAQRDVLSIEQSISDNAAAAKRTAEQAREEAQAIAEARRAERERRLVEIPAALQGRILQAQNENNLRAEARALIQARNLLQSRVTRPGVRQEVINQIRSNIESLQSSIQGVFSELNKATKEAATDFKRLADDVKNAVLERFDRQTQGIENKRALDDAKRALRLARQLGGPEGIRLATQDLVDAQRAVQRQRLEAAAFRFVGGNQGSGPGRQFQAGNVTVNINGATNPDVIADKVLAVIRGRGNNNSSQTRGRNPGILQFHP